MEPIPQAPGGGLSAASCTVRGPRHLRGAPFAVPARAWARILQCAMLLIMASDIRAAAPITALAFTPDGDSLVSNGSGSLTLHSPNDASALSRIPVATPRISALAFDPKGHFLAVAGGTPGVRGETEIWDWKLKRLARRITNDLDLATSAAFNNDGSLLGIASADHQARIWRVSSGNESLTEAFALTGHAGPVLTIAFSPTGRSIVTTSADRSVKVWSAGDGALIRTFTHHTEPVHAIAFRPMRGTASGAPPAFCATGGDDRTVRVWQPEIGRMVRIIRGHEGSIFALAYSTDGTTLYSAGKEGIIRRLDADSDTILHHWTAHGDWVYALAISPDGSKLASGDWSGEVRVWDLKEPGRGPQSGE